MKMVNTMWSAAKPQLAAMLLAWLRTFFPRTFSVWMIIGLFLEYSVALGHRGSGIEDSTLCLEYFLKVVKEEPHRFQVSVRISGIKSDSVLLAMTQNYGRVRKLPDLIPEIAILVGSRPVVQIDTVSEFLWKVKVGGHDGLTINYAVNSQFPYSSLNMVRLPYRDENHLYFPAASVFVHPDESFMEQHRLRIKAIRVSFDLPPGWFPATSWGVGKLRYELDPPNLNHLYLALIGLGSYRTYQASFDGLHLQTAILNQGCVAADSQFISDDRISNAIRLAFTTGRQVFGFYPLARHFSLIHFVFDNPGRINGSALGWSINLNYSRSFSRTQWVEMESHIFSEIFHLWNGTQDAPLSRSQDDHSTIWFTEGITHFYRLKNMVRSGVISEEEYFQLVGEEFTRVYHSSRGGDDLNKISEGYYTDREAMRMTYSKGCCLAFALDVLMRHIYADQKSFDDVMRTMLKRYDFRVNGHCYTHGELDSVLMDVLGAEQFSHYRKLFSGGFIKEFQHITEMVGLEIERERGERLYFGITNFGPPSVPAFLIDGMDRESPAFKAGIREKDILLEINGQLLQENVGLKKYVEGLSDKKPVDLTIRRGDRTLRIRTPWLSFQSKFKIRRR